jgi:hypothetical protein
VTTLVLDWAVMGSTARGEDADAIGRALKALGTVMVFSRADRANTIGRTRGLGDPWTGLAVVGTDGTLSFPFIGVDYGRSSDPRAEAAYTEGIDTVEEIRQAAAKPTWQAPTPGYGTSG